MREKTILSSRPVRIKDMIRALQVYDIMPGTDHAHGKQCSRHRGISPARTVPGIVTDWVFRQWNSSHCILNPEWKLDCTAWIQLKLNRDARTFITSHKIGRIHFAIIWFDMESLHCWSLVHDGAPPFSCSINFTRCQEEQLYVVT